MTVVYPLPAAGQACALLGPDDAGARGPLLPASAFEGGRAPETDERYPAGGDAERLSSLRAVALRFDPCQGGLAPPPEGVTCRPGVRMVFQSLREAGGMVAAVDGAVHAFYQPSEADFEAMLGGLRALRAESPDEPPVALGVHPRLAQEGPDGSYARRLKALVTAHVGAQNLVRVTHFRRLGALVQPGLGAQRWSFEIREPVGGVWQGSTIATTSVTRQELSIVNGGLWYAVVEPAPTHADDVTQMFSPRGDSTEGKAAFVRVMNPRIYSSESIDCGTCHAAASTEFFVGPGAPFIDASPEHFQSAYPTDAAPRDWLAPDVTFDTDSVHMLSYLGRQLVVSMRSANETTAALERVNGGLSKRRGGDPAHAGARAGMLMSARHRPPHEAP